MLQVLRQRSRHAVLRVRDVEVARRVDAIECRVVASWKHGSEIVILSGLARWTARQIEKVSLSYGERRFSRLVDHAAQRRVSDVEGSPPNLLLRVLRLLRQAVAGVPPALRFQSDEEVHGVLSDGPL